MRTGESRSNIKFLQLIVIDARMPVINEIREYRISVAAAIVIARYRVALTLDANCEFRGFFGLRIVYNTRRSLLNGNELNNGIAILVEFNLKTASPLYARECINRRGAHAPQFYATEDLVVRRIYIYGYRYPREKTIEIVSIFPS